MALKKPLVAGGDGVRAIAAGDFIDPSAGGTGVGSIAALKSALALDLVENKSSATIRSEITSLNVTDALGFTPAAASGGADPWTYVKLTANFLNSTTTNTSSLLRFTPEANSFYEVEGKLFLQSAATTTGPRPGISWPTGTTQEAAWMMAPSSATAFISRFWGAPTTANAASTGVAIANEGLYGQVKAMFLTGATPAGNWTITLASEISASESRIMANSFIRYRKIL